jgi:hypothetical protein
MSLSYDAFVAAFLSKVSEYEFVNIDEDIRNDAVDGYLKRAVAAFRKNCLYDLTSAMNDDTRCFDITIDDDDVDEIVEIVSEGMLVQWMKPFLYNQENLEHQLNTRDFTMYSPAELLMRIGNAYAAARKDYTNLIRDYSYKHGDLTKLHL